jgi:hypothetical protein
MFAFSQLCSISPIIESFALVRRSILKQLKNLKTLNIMNCPNITEQQIASLILKGNEGQCLMISAKSCWIFSEFSVKLVVKSFSMGL